MRLEAVVDAWGTSDFVDVLKSELEQAGGAILPLQRGLTRSGYALDDGMRIMVIRAAEAEGAIHAVIGVFYSGIIAGCNCADDPSPVEAQPEYCECLVVIDKATGEIRVQLVSDQDT